jgi:hypothetical protein
MTLEIMRRPDGDGWIYAIIMPLDANRVKIIEQKRFFTQQVGDKWADERINCHGTS